MESEKKQLNAQPVTLCHVHKTWILQQCCESLKSDSWQCPWMTHLKKQWHLCVK